MPLIKYDGRTDAVKVASNFTTVLAPVGVDATAPKVAEIEAGTAYQCSIRTQGITGSPNNITDQFLCDEDQQETPGSVTWSMDPIEIQVGDPQVANAFLDGLIRGDRRWVVERRGPNHDTAFAAGDRVSVAEVEVSHVEWVAAAANTNGDKFQKRLHFAVKRYVPDAVVAAA